MDDASHLAPAKLGQAMLKLQLGACVVPLSAWLHEAPARNRAPQSFVLPDLATSLHPYPVRDLALRELLSHADSGAVRLTLPLPRRVFGSGPMTLDLRAGHTAIIHLQVRQAAIVRERACTHGHIEPAIPLPLIANFRGLYLSDDGDLIADIENFFDFNLSRWIEAVPRIPQSLDALLALLEQDDETTHPSAAGDGEAEHPQDHAQADAAPLDLSALQVEARDVCLRPDMPLQLGPAGSVTFGHETRFDVDYSAACLAIRGHVHLPAAELRGARFFVEDLEARADVLWRMEGAAGDKQMHLQLRGAHLCYARGEVHAEEDSVLRLAPASLHALDAELRAGDGAPALDVRIDRFELGLDASQVRVAWGSERYDASLAPMHLTGHLHLAHGALELELVLSHFALTLPQLSLPLGPLTLALSDLQSQGQGTLTLHPEHGVSFVGDFSLRSEAPQSRLQLPQVRATTGPGSEAALELRRLRLTKRGIEEADGQAKLHLQLTGGSIQLAGSQTLRLAPGAHARIDLPRVGWQPGAAWPALTGTLQLHARSEATEGRFVLPSGAIQLEGALALQETGILELDGLTLDFATQDAE
ncbi:MAG: hypothetical protein ACPGUV_06010 [Polyangiales bacterium]